MELNKLNQVSNYETKPVKKGNRKKIGIIILLIIILLISGILGYRYFKVWEANKLTAVYNKGISDVATYQTQNGKILLIINNQTNSVDIIKMCQYLQYYQGIQ